MAESKDQIFTIPAGRPFARDLARGLLDQFPGDALADVLLLLPTRRAIRAVREAFLDLTDGQPLLLPKMQPLGDVEEEGLIVSGMESRALGDDQNSLLPPAIDPQSRRLLLARLVQGFRTADGRTLSMAEAVNLADDLARFLDEAIIEQVPLVELAGLIAQEEFADHWKDVTRFLDIIAGVWPKLLEDRGLIDPTERRQKLLLALADHWQAEPPTGPVIVAGSTGSQPATAKLMKVILGLPQGALVLPGLDQVMDRASWRAVDPSHPQNGLKGLLDHLEVDRGGVRNWPGILPDDAPNRSRLIAELFRPADVSDGWRDGLASLAKELRQVTKGVRWLQADNPAEEAAAIALAMREALDDPAKTVALITPDRSLARRVRQVMQRWDIEVDDSAGVPLNRTPPAIMMGLCVEAVAQDFAPLPLLALLKHPRVQGPEGDAGFRARVRDLERAALRGPRPSGGLQGLRQALGDQEADFADFLDWLDDAFAGFAAGSEPLSLSDLLEAHIKAAEHLAGIDGLWTGEAGDALSRHLAGLLEAAADETGLTVSLTDYPALFSALLQGPAVRPRFGTHPRAFIWGPLEARLQTADLLILSGLNEGVWPRTVASDPWVSRPMRSMLDLSQPERMIGLSAHDFAMALSAPQVLLTRSRKTADGPAVASRWWLRLETVLGKVPLTPVDYLHWWQQMRPENQTPLSPPAPTPPLEARPDRLSVTDIGKLWRDPYAIYAKRILGLKPLDPIDQKLGPAQRGTLIHEIFERFVGDHPKDLPDDAFEQLLAYGREGFKAFADDPIVASFWWPRFEQAARWFLNSEQKRRDGVKTIFVEQDGRLVLPVGASSFTLYGRADRIDQREDGSLIVYDYKTGEPPSIKQVESGVEPQLALEGMIAQGGGFEDIPKGPVDALTYLSITGKGEGGKERPAGKEMDAAALIGQAADGLPKLVGQYQAESQPYLSRPHMQFRSDPSDYDHLARVSEWSDQGGGDD